jgi:hypothetical protein
MSNERRVAIISQKKKKCPSIAGCGATLRAIVEVIAAFVSDKFLHRKSHDLRQICNQVSDWVLPVRTRGASAAVQRESGAPKEKPERAGSGFRYCG